MSPRRRLITAAVVGAVWAACGAVLIWQGLARGNDTALFLGCVMICAGGAALGVVGMVVATSPRSRLRP